MSTDLKTIAHICKNVCQTVDRITGDRSDYPLLVAYAAQRAMRLNNIQSNLVYGNAAWLEIINQENPIWAGCWGDHKHFWCVTPQNEVIDLFVGVAHKKRPKNRSNSVIASFSSPNLWSIDIPTFYRYVPEGLVEPDPETDREKKWIEIIFSELEEKCASNKISDNIEFPDEPFICPNRKVLDDSKNSFKFFDRVLSVKGVPEFSF